MANCKECGHPIDFIKTPAGKHMPVDPRPIYFEPDEYGEELLITDGGECMRGYLTEPSAHYDPKKVGYRPHFSTCPKRRKTHAQLAAQTAQAAEKKRREEMAADAARKTEVAAQGIQMSFYRR